MATVAVSKNQKKKHLSQIFAGQNSPEYNQLAQHKNKPKKTIGLRGILGLNQSVDINSKHESSNLFSQEIYQPSHLAKESTMLFSREKENLKQAIEELIIQIKKLNKSTHKIKKRIVSATLQPTTDTSHYQVSYLQRLKKFLQNMTQNVQEASYWVEMFAVRGKQRGKFWQKSRGKGGHLNQQYMFSGEHSISRSAG